MKASGTVYYFSGRASEEAAEADARAAGQPREHSRCTGANARRRGVDPEAAGGADQEVEVWLLSRPAHAHRHPPVHMPADTLADCPSLSERL